jgi:glycosyltransferase involved in cell wall biosynthesis
MSGALHAFTISSFNYLSQVAALRTSFLAQHPGSTFTVFLCDLISERSLPGGLPTEEVIEIRHVNIPNFEKMTYVYDLTEINTAVKPFCFLHMFDIKNVPFAFYIDPDIWFYSEMTECIGLINNNFDIILTPHTTDPIEDTDKPNDYSFALAGIYNLGFCGVRNSIDGRRFASWWARKLENDCRIDLPNGIFVDQKWCDAVPALFEKTHVLRHNGYNVAYWNLMHRPITVNNEGQYLANGEHLRFMHFSGIGMLDYTIVSKHQTRLNFDNVGNLCQILMTKYRLQLMRFGYYDNHRQPFMIQPPMRFKDLNLTRSYVNTLNKLLLDRGGSNRFPSIDDFWMESLRPETGSLISIPDFLYCVLYCRTDLLTHFNSVSSDADARGFLSWACTTLLSEMPILNQPVHFMAKVLFEALASEYLGLRTPYTFKTVRSSYVQPSEDTCGKAHGIALPLFLECYIKLRPDLAKAFDLKLKAGRQAAQQWFLNHFEDELGSTPSTINLISFVRSLAAKGGIFKRGSEEVRNTGAKKWHSRALVDYQKRTADTFATFNLDSSSGSVEKLKPGLTLIGYPHARMGMGEHVRNTSQCLLEQKLEFEVLDLNTGLNCDNDDVSLDDKIVTVPTRKINIFHTNADQTLVTRNFFGPYIFAGRYNIGYWAWELEIFPDQFRAAIDLMDELWAPSRFVQLALRRKTGKPVIVMPLRVELDIDSRHELALAPKESFSFLFYFDFNSFHQRKNPWAVLDAFSRAFPTSRKDDVKLVIKTIGHASQPEALKRLAGLVSRDTRIRLVTDSLSSEKMASLIANASCFVSLHRSEGFGRGMAEAMYFGKPVIATGYSGNMDFMSPENSYLVDYELVVVGDQDYVYPSGARWASPNVDHAASLMQHVYENPAEARMRGRKARAYMLQNHSTAAVGSKIADRLRELGGI